MTNDTFSSGLSLSDLYREAKRPVCENKTISMIPTIKVYRKSDNAKIINILMTNKRFSKQKKNVELVSPRGIEQCLHKNSCFSLTGILYKTRNEA